MLRIDLPTVYPSNYKDATSIRHSHVCMWQLSRLEMHLSRPFRMPTERLQQRAPRAERTEALVHLLTLVASPRAQTEIRCECNMRSDRRAVSPSTALQRSKLYRRMTQAENAFTDHSIRQIDFFVCIVEKMLEKFLFPSWSEVEGSTAVVRCVWRRFSVAVLHRITPSQRVRHSAVLSPLGCYLHVGSIASWSTHARLIYRGQSPCSRARLG